MKENTRINNLSDSLRHHTNMEFKTVLFTIKNTLFINVSDGDLSIEKEVFWFDDFDKILNQAISELTEKLNLPVLNL